MDDAKELIHWALQSRDRLSIELTNFKWTKQYGLDQSDFNFKFILNAKTYEGRGMSSTSETAIVKSIVEAIERTTVDCNSLKNSNGVAAHFDIQLAQENALCELIERDIFLCNFLSIKAGVREIENHLLPSVLLRSLTHFSHDNVEFKFYVLGTLLQRHVVLAIANGFKSNNPFGCVIGVSANMNLESAILSAFNETARSSVTYIADEVCSSWNQKAEDFFTTRQFSILEHKRLSMTKEHGLKIWEYYLQKKNSPLVESQIDLNRVNFNLLKLPVELRNLGISVYRAESDEVQNLFFGKTEIHNVNIKRLECYSKSKVTVDMINFLTHPLS